LPLLTTFQRIESIEDCFVLQVELDNLVINMDQLDRPPLKCQQMQVNVFYSQQKLHVGSPQVTILYQQRYCALIRYNSKRYLGVVLISR